VAAIFAKAEASAVAFEAALTNVQNTANLTADQTTALSKTLERLALGTTSTAVDMANALSPIVGELQLLTGHVVSAADATSILSAAQNLWVVKSIPLTTATKNIVDLLRTYKLSTSDAASVSDALVQGADLLGINVAALATSFTRLQPKIAGSGLSMQQLLGIVVDMGPAVGTGARAMMQVGTVIHALIVPSKAAAKALDSIGVSLYDAKGNYIGAEAAIQKISVAYNKLGTQAQKTALLQSIFGAQAGMVATLIAGGAAGIDKATAELIANGTAAQKAALKMQDAQEQMAMLPKTIDDISTAIGMVLLPGLNRILSAIMPVVLGFGDWMTQNPELATTILAVAAGLGLLAAGLAFLGPVLAAVGTVIGLLLSPVILVGAGIAALVIILAGVPAVVGPFKDLFGSLVTDAKSLIGPLVDVGKAIFNLFTGKGNSAQVGAALGNLGGAVDKVLADIGPKLLKLGQALVAWIIPAAGQALVQLGILGGRIVNWLIAEAPLIASTLVGWAVAFVQWFAPLYLQYLQFLGKIATTVTGWIVDNAPQIAATFVGWGGAFVAWISPMIGKALAQLGVWAGKIVGWIKQQAPKFVATLVSWAGAFIGWLIPVTLQVLGALGDFASSVVDWLMSDGVPMLADAASSLFDTLAEWLPEVLPGALVSLATFAAAMLAGLAALAANVLLWIAKQVPKIIPKLALWGLAFVGWIAQRIPGLLTALGGLMAKILGWIAGQVGAIAGAVVGWGLAFVGWVAGAIGGLLSSLAGLIGQVLGWIVANGPSIAAQLLSWVVYFTGWLVTLPLYLLVLLGVALKSIVDWIIANGPQIATTFANWIPKAVQWVIDLITSLPGKLFGIIGAIGSWVTINGPSLASKFGTFAVKGLEWIATLIASIPSKLLGIMGSVATWVATNGAGMIRAFSGLAAKGVQWITDLITSLPGKLLGIVTAITTWVTTSGPSVVKALAGMGSNFVSGIINGLSGLPGALAKSIGDAFRKLDFWVGPFHITGSGITVSMPKISFPSISLPNFGLATGAWNLAHDAVATVHAGEMVVPAKMARDLRAALGAVGTMNSAPTLSTPASPSWGSAIGSAGGGDTVIHTHVMLDGRQITEVVDRHQGQRYLLSGSSRYRATGN
jgi:TP901 family phage tail tape measure protein